MTTCVGLVAADAARAAEVDPLPSKGEPSDSATVDGTDADEPKAEALGRYQVALAAWFRARFQVAGKLPFGVLKDLRATVTVHVAPMASTQRVVGYALRLASGNTVFDATVTETMDAIVAKGEALPSPPFPQLLGKSFNVSFHCASRSACN